MNWNAQEALLKFILNASILATFCCLQILSPINLHRNLWKIWNSCPGLGSSQGNLVCVGDAGWGKDAFQSCVQRNPLTCPYLTSWHEELSRFAVLKSLRLEVRQQWLLFLSCLHPREGHLLWYHLPSFTCISVQPSSRQRHGDHV